MRDLWVSTLHSCGEVEQSIRVAITETKALRGQKLSNLLQRTQVVKIGTQDVYIDPAILFTRLLVLVKISEDLVSYFQYELTLYLESVFNGDYMRHVYKALLGHAITDRGDRASGRRSKW